jgi:nicotinamide-nucleotide amidase
MRRDTSAADLAARLAQALGKRGWRLATAESCTGGSIAAICTSLPGSSAWFECGFVAYSLEAKQRMLGVAASLLVNPGPVSEPVARDMALGALTYSRADVAVATTGIAGPGGGEPATPVGTVWFAWAMRAADGTPQLAHAASHRFQGSRDTVCDRAVCTALEGTLKITI